MLICPKTIALKTEVQRSISRQLNIYTRIVSFSEETFLSCDAWAAVWWEIIYLFIYYLWYLYLQQEKWNNLTHPCYTFPPHCESALSFYLIETSWPFVLFVFNARMRKSGWAEGLNSLLIRNEKPSCYVLGSEERCANLLSLTHLRDFFFGGGGGL